jgi:tRNA dimethylallyltransferase
VSGVRPALVVVAGTTASGKTELALALARRLGGELVGADSVQVYRGFDVGSAKPTAEELGGIAHHLLDVVDPDEAIDAARYASLADAAIAGVASRGRLPIVVGGTGLWLRALVRGLVALPAPDPTLRASLEAEVARDGAPRLHARLAAIDPRAAVAIHPHDALRIVRALEVHAQTGEALGELRHRHALGAPRYPTLFLALDRPREELRVRLTLRVRSMLERGWVDEVRRLLARWGPDVRAFGSVGYREVLAHVRGELSAEAAEAGAVRASWVYARRQRTWFRSEPGVDLRLDDGPPGVESLLPAIEDLRERAARGEPSPGGRS